MATDLGDVRLALSLFADAKERAARFGLAKLERIVGSARALLLLSLGRGSEGRAALEALRVVKGDPCERAADDINVAYAALLERETKGSSPLALDVEATLLRATTDAACGDAYLKALAFSNLAYDARLRGDAKKTLEYVRRAKARVATPKLEELLFQLDLEASALVLSGGDSALALRLFDRERGLATGAAMFDAVWRAESGRAELFAKNHDGSRALRAYAAAESALDRSSRRVPFVEGRGHYLAGRDRSARGHLELLIAQHREDEAYRLARRSRSRVLRALAKESRLTALSPEARTTYERALEGYRQKRLALDAEAAEDWRKSQTELALALTDRAKVQHDLSLSLDDALRALGEGFVDEAGSPPAEEGRDPTEPNALSLLAFSVPGREYVFAATDKIRVLTRKAAPAEERPLTEELRVELASALRVHVLASGSLQGDDVLGPLRPDQVVDYPLDVRAAKRAEHTATKAFVVADPLSDLPNSKLEAARAKSALTTLGLRVEEVVGTSATHASLSVGLSTADFFHYAGHAKSGGLDGWNAGLPLAQGGGFAVGDILSLPRAPDVAVVFGCEGALTSEEGVETLGVAQAFVMSGSAVAVAPLRPIDDALANRFAASFYDALGKTSAGDTWKLRVTRAVATARREIPEAKAFRAIVP